jgi:hypothetical protein
MKPLLLSLLFVQIALAQTNCAPGTLRYYHPSSGYFCGSVYKPQLPADSLCTGWGNSFPIQNAWLNSFPYMYQQPMPYWAHQGNSYYPNMMYPGVWQYPGINSQHYPGKGEVFAAKPNIYVQTIHADKKFEIAFPREEKNFLALTPILDERNTWKGRFSGKDQFDVNGVVYDYLFYDIRLGKEHMQFERGLCVSREDAIKWMLTDLKEMNYPPIALQDFEEHWRVKIPDFPFYCVYPQYNTQLDNALPMSTNLEQLRFNRALYILYPHKKEPSASETYSVPLPRLDSQEIRPESTIQYEVMLNEWGVAFLGE